MTGLKNHRHVAHRAGALLLAIAIVVLASTQLRADTGTCSGASLTLPFNAGAIVGNAERQRTWQQSGGGL